MKTTRRNFITTAVAGSLAAAVPGSAFSKSPSSAVSEKVLENYEKLDKILKLLEPPVEN